MHDRQPTANGISIGQARPATAAEPAAHENLVACLRELQAELEASTICTHEVQPLVRLLSACQNWLRKPVRIAILGEYNTGKSSLANLLIDGNALPTSVISCTAIPTRVYFAERTEINIFQAGTSRHVPADDEPAVAGAVQRIDIGLPVAILQHCEIWDFPGELGTIAATESVARECAPDIVIWCTDATQAWKESERELWQRLPLAKGTKSILAVTFSDLIPDPENQFAVLNRLRTCAAALFGDIVMVSSLASAAATRDECHNSPAALTSAIARLSDDVRHGRTAKALRMLSLHAARTSIGLKHWDAVRVRTASRIPN